MKAIKKQVEVKVPTDLRNAIASVPKAEAQWKSITPLARKDWVLWLSTAKKAETRVRRIEKACSMLASGKKRVCCFGGEKWLIKTGQIKK